MSEPKENLEWPVLRVNHIDSAELNDSILLNIKQSINEDYFKYIQFNFFHKYHVEINAALKFILWYYTYGKTDQTISQVLLNWKYSNAGSSHRVVAFKKLAHCLFYCLDEWFQEKFFHLFKKLYRIFLKKKRPDQDESNEDRLKKIEIYYNYLSAFYKLATFINYVAFLFNGTYLSLWERLFNLKPVYTKPQFLHQLNLDASIREEMWYSCFNLFKLSENLLNLSKLKKKYLSFEQKDDSVLITNKNVCIICGKEPTLAHVDSMLSVTNKDQVLTPCQHVYCYYCIQKEIQENNNYYCSICAKYINEIELYHKN